MSNKDASRALRDRIDREWRVLDGIQKLIERADTKANFVFAIDTILAGVFLSNLGVLRTVMRAPGTGVFSLWACLVAAVVFIVLLGIGLASLVGVVLPQMGKKDGKTLIFAGHLANEFNGDLARLSVAFAGHGDEAWALDLEHQILENSVVAVVKMARITTALRWSAGALIAWMVTICLVQLLAPQTP